MFRLCPLLLAVGSYAQAHDVSVDVSGTFTSPSSNNPRVGAWGLAASGSYDITAQWSVTASVLYLRDLPTRAATSSSSGSNVFQGQVGVVWLVNESLMTMLTVMGSPKSAQNNATTVTLQNGPADVVVQSQNSNIGAVWNGLWASDGFSDLEHVLDVGLGFHRFDVFQQILTPNTPAGRLVEQLCQQAPRTERCTLVRGLNSPLWQGRADVGYTATLQSKTDLGLSASYFWYDVDPSTVGYFSVVSLGRAELGTGVPVLPLQLSVKPSVLHRLGPISLKASYQWGWYAQNLGSVHALTAKVSWKVNHHWQLAALLTGQVDVSGATVSNGGTQALLSTTYIW
jgi:hypothetical protein